MKNSYGLLELHWQCEVRNFCLVWIFSLKTNLFICISTFLTHVFSTIQSHFLNSSNRFVPAWKFTWFKASANSLSFFFHKLPSINYVSKSRSAKIAFQSEEDSYCDQLSIFAFSGSTNKVKNILRLVINSLLFNSFKITAFLFKIVENVLGEIPNTFFFRWFQKIQWQYATHEKIGIFKKLCT